jgi:hypothetical protein
MITADHTSRPIPAEGWMDKSPMPDMEVLSQLVKLLYMYNYSLIVL